MPIQSIIHNVRPLLDTSGVPEPKETGKHREGAVAAQPGLRKEEVVKSHEQHFLKRQQL